MVLGKDTNLCLDTQVGSRRNFFQHMWRVSCFHWNDWHSPVYLWYSNDTQCVLGHIEGPPTQLTSCKYTGIMLSDFHLVHCNADFLNLNRPSCKFSIKFTTLACLFPCLFVVASLYQWLFFVWSVSYLPTAARSLNTLLQFLPFAQNLWKKIFILLRKKYCVRLSQYGGYYCWATRCIWSFKLKWWMSLHIK